MGQSGMNMTPRAYSMPGNQQSQYMQGGAAAGNWGMGMYPQMAMSPVNPNSLPGSLPGNGQVDPNFLASQLSQMHIGQGVSVQPS